MTPPASPIRLGSIEELRFSAVLSDLDGVIHRGDEAGTGKRGPDRNRDIVRLARPGERRSRPTSPRYW